MESQESIVISQEEKNPAYVDQTHYSLLTHCQESLVRGNKNQAFEDQTHYSRPTGSSGRASLITHFRESSIVRRESGTANIIALDFDFKLFSRLEHSHHSLSVISQE